ncbi:hypothetical protein GCM10010307_18760 [Streptomyces vastus]|uniref:Uncharacterized protein n=1 Tax=Streptomyces vastus TaxID=285451 RepID=A0ABN3QKF0_9ACTN
MSCGAVVRSGASGSACNGAWKCTRQAPRSEFGDDIAGRPQADAEPLPYGFGVRGELREHPVQVLRLMDVAAVREVDGCPVGMAQAHRPLTLRRA